MQQNCDFLELQHLLGNKYTLPILFQLKKDKLRFNQIKKITKERINNTLLIKTLKGLKRFNLVEKTDENKIIYYQITENGEKIISNISMLVEHIDNPKKCNFNCFDCDSF